MGAPQPSIHESMFVDQEELPNGTRALLAMAVARAGGSEKMVEDLLRLRASGRKAFGFISHADTEAAMLLLPQENFHCIPFFVGSNLLYKNHSQIPSGPSLGYN